jgi:hypothetical protein
MSKTNEQSWQFRDGPCLKNERDVLRNRHWKFRIVRKFLNKNNRHYQRPTGTAATIADEAVRLFGERLHLAPQDILFAFYEVEPNFPRFPAGSIRRDPTADA